MKSPPPPGKSSLNIAQALHEALGRHQAGQLDHAQAGYTRVLAAQPDNFDALHMLGVLRSQQGRHAEAVSRLSAALKLKPADDFALMNLGTAQYRLGLLADALASYDKALAVKPEFPEVLHSRGNVLIDLGRHAEAIDSFDRALALRPELVDAMVQRGSALLKLGRLKEALACQDRALALAPVHADALCERGAVLFRLGRREEALASFDKALTAKSDHVEALANRGSLLMAMGRPLDALASYDRALKVAPKNADVLYNRGRLLRDLKRLPDALASIERSLAIRPEHAATLTAHASFLVEAGRLEQALVSANRAIILQPDNFEAHAAVGNALFALKRYDEALLSYERALALNADYRIAFSGIVAAALYACNWEKMDQLAPQLPRMIVDYQAYVQPFALLAYPGCLQQTQLANATGRARLLTPGPPAPLWRGERYRHDKVRIAYLSGDFRRHPFSYLTAQMFELHDRSRFEIIAFSYGEDDGSEIRRRMKSAFDRFEDVSARSDADVAGRIRDLEVDIAVDLTGFTKGGRSSILAHRPAPVQASYMGFPGTMGADFIDYILADPVVLPFDQQEFYAERIVHLPDTYWVTDRELAVAAGTPTRAEAGLPESGFVFCCFNNTYKITAGMLDIWTRILNRVPGSVLWLLDDNATSVRNMRREAAARGLDPARLVFAPRMDLPPHMARHRLADLVLDTLPYNAHTTASDALWMGVPVLTRIGTAFAGRVAASLLSAIELPELITDTPEAYEALAVALALEPERLAALRTKLAANRLTTPLFDTPRFTRNMEAAFTRMRDISRRGEPPQSFSV